MVAQMTGLVKTLVHIMSVEVTVTVTVTVTVVDCGLATDYPYEGPK